MQCETVRERLVDRLSGGGDSIATLTDSTYVGVDDPTPENRTGLHTLRNIEEISIKPGGVLDLGGGLSLANAQTISWSYELHPFAD